MAIHPSHDNEVHLALRVVGVALLLLVLTSLLPAIPGLHGLGHYLPLHTSLEILSVTIAALVFATGWHSFQHEVSGNLRLVAVLFLGVALLDFSHTLSFAGMPDFITPNSSEKAIIFWLAARTLAAAALLVAAFRAWEKPALSRWIVIPLLALVIGLHVWFLYYPHSLPRTYIPGEGLTLFKRAYEFGLIAAYSVAAVALLRHTLQPRRFNASGLFAASALMAMSEYFLTRYAVVDDTNNLLGHLYKCAAYLFLYQVFFVETVRLPYQQLAHSRVRLQGTLRTLQAQREEMDAFFNANLDLFCIADEKGHFLRANPEWEKVLGYRGSEITGRRFIDFVHPDDAERTLAEYERLQNGGGMELFENRYRCRDGSYRHIEWRAIPKGNLVYAAARDVTERKLHEESMRKLSQAIDQSPFPIVITDLDARIDYVNEAFCRATGYSPEDVHGRNPRILQSGKTPAAVYQDLWEKLTAGKSWQGELVNRTRDGREYTEHTLIYPLRDINGNITHYLAHKEDISAQKAADERIRQLSHYDQLTGLPNRALLERHFASTVQRRPNHPQSVVWLNLDNFKEINDALGHKTGDLVLQEMANRLRLMLREQDNLCRVSGDNFVFVFPDTDERDVSLIIDRIIDALSAPISLNNQDLIVSASAGVAVYPADSTELEKLMAQAEGAMYRAKEDGRNQYRFFASDMQEHAGRMLTISNALKQALQRNEFHLVYQPQYDVDGQRIIGAEVLLRWCHPQLGDISPGEFISVAEANGQIVAIGDWVMDTAMAQFHQWITQGIAPQTLALNLSAVQFAQPGIAERIYQRARHHQIPCQRIELELTEAVAMKNPDAAAQIMRELSEHGFLLSIDDFGTGYSSLSYLKRFSVGKLKIDQSFIRDVDSNSGDQAIVVAIIQMARTLGMLTIAEGVERQAQLVFLRERGCDEIQGYLFSKPLPAAPFETLLRAREYAR